MLYLSVILRMDNHYLLQSLPEKQDKTTTSLATSVQNKQDKHELHHNMLTFNILIF
jgi:hypothetical protein